MTYPTLRTAFSWVTVAIVLAAVSAVVCAFVLPPGAAGPLAGVLALATALLGWRLRGHRSIPEAPIAAGAVAVADSLPGSEARLRLLESAVVHAHDAVVILQAGPEPGPGRSVLYVNEAFCKLSGYSRSEVIGRSLHFLRGPDSDPETLARLRAAMDAGTPLRVELRNYRKDGTPFWVDLSAVPVPDPAGRVSHWLLIQRDIDRRKSAERRARHTGQLLRAIIDAFPGVINAQDRDGKYLVMNQFQAKLLGTTPEAAVGKTASELADPQLGGEETGKHAEVIATCQPTQYEERYGGRGGDPRPWLTSKAPLWMPDGVDSEPAGARGVVTVSLDISALKDAEDALRRSEERYRQLFKAIPHPVFVYDATTFQFLAVNEAAVRKYGYSREEFSVMTLRDIRPPDDTPRSVGSLNNKGAGDSSLTASRHRTRSGALIDVEVSSFALNLDGRAIKLALVTDVTERRKAEDELRRSEELFRGMFASTSAGVSLTDPSGRFVSCNPAFAAMLGRTVEDVLQLTAQDITHPDDWTGQYPLLAEVTAGVRDRFSYAKRYLRADGEPVWVELSFAAIRGPTGEYEHGLGVSVNVTERRLLEEQLRQAQKMEAVGQMAGGVAHDFNNLLTAVLGNLSMVRLPESDPNRPFLATVEQAATRAADLTKKLLGYARRNQLVFAPVDPTEALGEVLALLRHTLDPRIELTIEVDPDCRPVHADPTLLAQALMNLCLNARDAMPEGGTLTLSATPVEFTSADPRLSGWDDIRPGPYVRLAVIDTGSGMSEEVQARLFEPFFTTKGPGKGTGLGLPMVHGIVKQHRGWITVHSAPGDGTRVELNLPTADLSATPPPRSGAYLALTATPQPIDAPDTPTVLLVDDEAMIRDLGSAVLTRAGFRVLTADDGVEAVELFTREHTSIDLVILDVTMPRMSGRDAIRYLTEINPSARILFSTGYTADDLTEVDGSMGLLSKPYRPQELVAAVRAALTVPHPVS